MKIIISTFLVFFLSISAANAQDFILQGIFRNPPFKVYITVQKAFPNDQWATMKTIVFGIDYRLELDVSSVYRLWIRSSNKSLDYYVTTSEATTVNYDIDLNDTCSNHLYIEDGMVERDTCVGELAPVNGVLVKPD